MSSSDGFCSTLSFSPGELGQPYTASTSVPKAISNPSPVPTPTPISPTKTSHTPNTIPSTVSQPPPASPARSSSACSMSNPSAQQSAPVINNPTPTLGSVPLVTAVNSQPPVLPLTTPPQTPLSAVSQTGPGSVSGSVLGKREARTASESEKEEKDQERQQPKKRRVAPTLVSADTNPAPDPAQN